MAPHSQEYGPREDGPQEDDSQGDGYIDPRLLETTGGAQEVDSEVPDQTHLGDLEEFERHVDDSLHNPNDVHGSQLNRPHDSFYTTDVSPRLPSYPYDQLPSTPLQGYAHQSRGNLPTPAHSTHTPSSNLDPQAPLFCPGNVQWPPNMPLTPSSPTSAWAQQDPFAGLVFDRAGQNDITEGEASYLQPHLGAQSWNGGYSVSWPGNGTLPPMARLSRPTLHQHPGSAEAPPINVSGWQQVGTPPSHAIRAWVQGSYTVPGSTLQVPHNGAPSRQRRRARTSASRPASSAGRSQGEVSDSVSLLCSGEGCGKTFDTKSKLSKHERYHLPGPLQCSVCGEKSHFEKDLSRHMRTHTKEKPFKCPMEECSYHEKGFSRKDNRNRHVKLEHSRSSAGSSMAMSV